MSDSNSEPNPFAPGQSSDGPSELELDEGGQSAEVEPTELDSSGPCIPDSVTRCFGFYRDVQTSKVLVQEASRMVQRARDTVALHPISADLRSHVDDVTRSTAAIIRLLDEELVQLQDLTERAVQASACKQLLSQAVRTGHMANIRLHGQSLYQSMINYPLPIAIMQESNDGTDEDEGSS